jgi:hypothetical protein
MRSESIKNIGRNYHSYPLYKWVSSNSSIDGTNLDGAIRTVNFFNLPVAQGFFIIIL